MKYQQQVQLSIDVTESGRIALLDSVNKIISYWETGDPMKVEVHYFEGSVQKVKPVTIENVSDIVKTAQLKGLSPIQALYNSILIRLSNE